MTYDIIVGRGEADKTAFGDKALTYIGKGYVKMGQYTSLSNKIFMDVARSHVILVAGKRGSGKSYTLGVLAEELANLEKEAKENIASLIFDTMGIYWTMKYKNEKDLELLKEWGLKSQNLPVKIFVPFGHYDSYVEKGIPVDKKFALDPTELDSEDWILTFDLKITEPVAVLIERTITRLKSKSFFSLKDVITEIALDSKTPLDIKNAATGLFEAAETWQVFASNKKEATQISDLVTSGTTSILDLSVYNSVGVFNVRALVISLISRKIFNQRMAARKAEEVESVSKGLDYLTQSQKKKIPWYGYLSMRHMNSYH